MIISSDSFRVHDGHDHQLSLITSVLGASAGLYIHSLLRETLSCSDKAVIILSFTHDKKFYLEGARKMGVDPTNATTQDRFFFVDGLQSLFLNSQRMTTNEPVVPTANGASLRNVSNFITETLTTVTAKLRKNTTVLVVQNPEILLAGCGALSLARGMHRSNNTIYPILIHIPQIVTSTVLVVNADSSLITRNSTRLEMEHSAFVLTLAHQASTTVSLRMLDTGVAKDVSGIIRVTKNKGCQEMSPGIDFDDEEFLYVVKDSSINMFNRGE
ncbi:hypothetical protein EDC01DRAFT_742591, partial [Geopyxis carbonaria]